MRLWKNLYGTNGEDKIDANEIWHNDNTLGIVLDGIRIPKDANLNHYQTPGRYYNPANVDVATMTNTPSDYAFGLDVIKAAGVVQIWYEYGRTTTSNKIYTRTFYNTWGPWREICLDRNIQSGSISIVPSSSNTASANGQIWYKGSARINFSPTFPGTPNLTLGMNSADPWVANVGFNNLDYTGFVLHLSRRNTNSTLIHWTAVYN